jgi:hypothetical protein
MEPIGFICPQPHHGRFPANQTAKVRITAMSDNLIGEHPTEKRTVRRHKVLKGATIAFEGTGIACTVRNLSSHGAALDFTNRVTLPASFMLVIESDQVIRRCHPIWSNEKRIGVAFD